MHKTACTAIMKKLATSGLEIAAQITESQLLFQDNYLPFWKVWVDDLQYFCKSMSALFLEFIDLNIQYTEGGKKAWLIPFPREWSFCSGLNCGKLLWHKGHFYGPAEILFCTQYCEFLWQTFIIRAYPVSDDGDVICVALLFSKEFQHVWITRKWRVWKAQLPIREEMHSGWIVELSS